MRAPLAYVGTRSRRPPSSAHTDWPRALPRMSQHAVSMAESASVKIPPGPELPASRRSLAAAGPRPRQGLRARPASGGAAGQVSRGSVAAVLPGLAAAPVLGVSRRAPGRLSRHVVLDRHVLHVGLVVHRGRGLVHDDW